MNVNSSMFILRICTASNVNFYILVRFSMGNIYSHRYKQIGIVYTRVESAIWAIAQLLPWWSVKIQNYYNHQSCGSLIYRWKFHRCFGNQGQRRRDTGGLFSVVSLSILWVRWPSSGCLNCAWVVNLQRLKVLYTCASLQSWLDLYISLGKNAICQCREQWRRFVKLIPVRKSKGKA